MEVIKITNIGNYIQEIVDGLLILTPKDSYNFKKMNITSLTKSDKKLSSDKK